MKYAINKKLVSRNTKGLLDFYKVVYQIARCNKPYTIENEPILLAAIQVVAWR